MDIITFLIAVVLGYLGAATFGNWLNWPDAGAILAIAFVGARIVKKLDGASNSPESQDRKHHD